MDKIKVLFTNESPLIKHGLASGFNNLGHKVFICQDKYRLWDKSKDEQTKLFIEAMDIFQPDLVFSECFADFSEQIFEYTKKARVPHFFYSIEDTPFDHWIGDYWSPYADHIFTTTAECLMNYWSKGFKADLLPFGVNPDYHKPGVFDSNRASEVILVGSNYERREQQAISYYYPIIKSGYNFHIYGNQWWMDENRNCNLTWTPETYKGFAPYESLGDLYSSTKIILGAQCDDKSYTQMSMRNFEVLGWAGDSAIMISPYSPAQEFLFGEHIMLPHDPDEMLFMIKKVLNMSDTERLNKAKEAQRYVYKYHNYNIRAQKVIDSYKKLIGE